MKFRDKPCPGCSVHCFVKNCMGGMTKEMRLQAKRTAALSQANAEAVTQDAAQPANVSNTYPLLLLIGDLLDEIAKGEDMYMIVGATSNKTSFVVTVKHNGTPTSVYGSSISELGLACQDLL